MEEQKIISLRLPFDVQFGPGDDTMTKRQRSLHNICWDEVMVTFCLYVGIFLFSFFVHQPSLQDCNRSTSPLAGGVPSVWFQKPD